jgi:transposase
MIGAQEFQRSLSRLGLTPKDAALVFKVSMRTIQRWLQDPSTLPEPDEQLLRAWLRLHDAGLAWRPGCIDIGITDQKELDNLIGRHRNNLLDLDALLRRVKERGGPVAPWTVDLKSQTATLGPITIVFDPLVDGLFSPRTYWRRDDQSTKERDWPLIEDGFACIAQAIAKAGPNWAE